jgi:hypothetical protein
MTLKLAGQIYLCDGSGLGCRSSCYPVAWEQRGSITCSSTSENIHLTSTSNKQPTDYRSASRPQVAVST